MRIRQDRRSDRPAPTLLHRRRPADTRIRRHSRPLPKQGRTASSSSGSSNAQELVARLGLGRLDSERVQVAQHVELVQHRNLATNWTGGRRSAAVQPVAVRSSPSKGAAASPRSPWLRTASAVPEVAESVRRGGNARLAADHEAAGTVADFRRVDRHRTRAGRTPGRRSTSMSPRAMVDVAPLQAAGDADRPAPGLTSTRLPSQSPTQRHGLEASGRRGRFDRRTPSGRSRSRERRRRRSKRRSRSGRQTSAS